MGGWGLTVQKVGEGGKTAQQVGDRGMTLLTVGGGWEIAQLEDWRLTVQSEGKIQMIELCYGILGYEAAVPQGMDASWMVLMKVVCESVGKPDKGTS